MLDLYFSTQVASNHFLSRKSPLSNEWSYGIDTLTGWVIGWLNSAINLVSSERLFW